MKIGFRQDTLRDLYSVAQGMGIPGYRDMARVQLENAIQSMHSAACRREARAEGGPGEAARQAALMGVPRR